MLVEALDAGHRLGRGKSGDLLLEQDGAILLNRAAWKPGYGIGLKTVTGFFDNPEPDAAAALDPGRVRAVRPRGRPAARGDRRRRDHRLEDRGRFGAGLALSLPPGRQPPADGRRRRDGGAADPGPSQRPPRHRAGRHLEPDAGARRGARRASLRAQGLEVEVDRRPRGRGRAADVVSVATRSEAPVIRGEWLRPGTHLDLVGAFTATHARGGRRGDAARPAVRRCPRDHARAHRRADDPDRARRDPGGRRAGRPLRSRRAASPGSARPTTSRSTRTAAARIST